MTEKEKLQEQTTALLRTSQSWDGAELPDYPQGRPELVCRMFYLSQQGHSPIRAASRRKLTINRPAATLTELIEAKNKPHIT